MYTGPTHSHCVNFHINYGVNSKTKIRKLESNLEKKKLSGPDAASVVVVCLYLTLSMLTGMTGHLYQRMGVWLVRNAYCYVAIPLSKDYNILIFSSINALC